MNEPRRLLIDQRRLRDSLSMDNLLCLTHQEKHYLIRVLRLKKGEFVFVVDGQGNLWKAFLEEFNFIKLTSAFDDPLIHQPRSRILVCLAVALPKRGFDDVLRMGCEIGVDVFQPLTSEYRVSKGDMKNKYLRWNSILAEAVEQSERLWIPELRDTIGIKDWVKNLPIKSAHCIATTRGEKSIEFTAWMERLHVEIKNVWVAIGPEGGWSEPELELAMESGCQGVTFGETILRTPTAAIAASQLMVTWRLTKTSC